MITLASLVSRLSNNEKVVSAVSSIFTLFLAMISGAFMPSEMLGKNIVLISKFFPEYYSTKNIEEGVFNGKVLFNLSTMIAMGILYFLVRVFIDRTRREI